MSDPIELQLIARIRSMAAESPNGDRIANRAIARYRTSRRSGRIAFLRPLAAIALVLTCGVGILYFVPVAGVAVADAPFTSSILSAAGLADLADRISSVDDSSTQGGTTLRLIGGYADATRSILLIATPTTPRQQVLIGASSLTDQFGQMYREKGAVQDEAANQAAIIFAPLQPPASMAGARLTLRISALRPRNAAAVQGSWQLHATLVQQGQQRVLDSPHEGFAGSQRVRFGSAVLVPHGLRLTVLFPGATVEDVSGVIADGSPKGRPAVVLQLVSSSAGSSSPLISELVQSSGSPGFESLWVVSPGGYTVAVDYRGNKLLTSQINIPAM